MARGSSGQLQNIAARLATEGARQKNAAFDPVMQALQQGGVAGPGLPFDPNDPMSVMPAPAPKGKGRVPKGPKAVKGRMKK